MVQREGDGSFAVEHPPDLRESQSIYKTRKQIIYYTTNREAAVKPEMQTLESVNTHFAVVALVVLHP